MNAPKIASAPAIASEVADLVRGSLLPKNSVGIASVAFYVAVLAEVGVDPESLSFAETVEVTRRLYAPSADFRRDEATRAAAKREAEKAEARAKRDAEAVARTAKKIAELEAELAKRRG